MKHIYKIIAIILIAAILGFSIYQQFNKPKTAYVNLTKLYNGFEYKKDLEKKLTNVQQARQNILDSLELELKLIVNQIKSSTAKDTSKYSSYSDLKDVYLTKKEQFYNDNEETVNTYTSQIWKQLNQYVTDYGKKNHYTYIFGTDGSGAIMYSSSKEDITEEVLTYVNKEYNGTPINSKDTIE
jgi:outer membrane protein